MASLALAVTFIALVLAGAMAGFFYAYSMSVMWALDAVDPKTAIASMQSINIVVRNAIFFPAFFGTPVVALLAAGLWWKAGAGQVALLLALAAIVYLAGAFLLTILANVPMNEALAVATIPIDPEAARTLWRNYSGPWTLWNHVRTLASLISLLLVGWALYAAGQA
ncbi:MULTISPECIES: anthrone oxygenase family protein [unclassified Bosea (in: a-proteobacteria)]|uniref:anthrone oxygenase family protein n=1 Tax=unclassified Bosea (in: a-proteobacteria) TaxID=2653178 RepID=UPI000F757A5D|nr:MULTISPECIES: anthrone oxygenase family protein [unclassified Bosea (in: a-proteobacteria)]AZO76277.1 hypothetical protein BLM15_00710 [Bosea sp. Tri-49]RXT26205.1 hypothetical protein B5U98_06620 [Bosea sp. Tri-39]RXT31447.1 hypothetical protein B5U99_22165 [Bosea sp. Tri-54]